MALDNVLAFEGCLWVSWAFHFRLSPGTFRPSVPRIRLESPARDLEPHNITLAILRKCCLAKLGYVFASAAMILLNSES